MGVGDIMAKGKSSKKNNKKGSNKKINESKTVNKSTIDIKNAEKNDIISNDKKEAVIKAKRNLTYYSNDSTDEMSKLLKIILIVTGIMVIFYGVTVFVTKKVNAVKTAKLGKSSKKATIQYDNIILGSMLNMDGHYFVLVEKENDENSSEYETLLKSIEANDESLKIYIVDLGSSFNRNYLGKDSNYDSDLTKFKVSDTTLVEVENHNIVDTFDSHDSIKEKLDELA